MALDSMPSAADMTYALVNRYTFEMIEIILCRKSSFLFVLSLKKKGQNTFINKLTATNTFCERRQTCKRRRKQANK